MKKQHALLAAVASVMVAGVVQAAPETVISFNTNGNMANGLTVTSTAASYWGGIAGFANGDTTLKTGGVAFNMGASGMTPTNYVGRPIYFAAYSAIQVNSWNTVTASMAGQNWVYLNNVTTGAGAPEMVRSTTQSRSGTTLSRNGNWVWAFADDGGPSEVAATGISGATLHASINAGSTSVTARWFVYANGSAYVSNQALGTLKAATTDYDYTAAASDTWGLWDTSSATLALPSSYTIATSDLTNITRAGVAFSVSQSSVASASIVTNLAGFSLVVPEPATASLLGLSAVGLLRRRRKA